MNLTVSQNETECRLTIHGEIDERGAEELKRRFREISGQRSPKVVLDFREVTHIGSAGVGKLLVLYKDLAVHDSTLTLVNVPHTIYRLLCEMGLDTIFSISEAASA